MPPKKTKRTRPLTLRTACILSCLIGQKELRADEIRKKAKAEFKHAIPRGSVYVTLDRLVEEGLVDRRHGERDPAGFKPAYYKINAPGKAALRDWELAAMSIKGVLA